MPSWITCIKVLWRTELQGHRNRDGGWHGAALPLDHGCQDNNAVITCTQLMVIKLSRAAVGVSRHQKPEQELWSAPDTCVWHVSDTCPHLIGMPVGESHWVCENKGRKQTQERQGSRTQRELHSTLTFSQLALYNSHHHNSALSCRLNNILTLCLCSRVQ